MKLMGEGILFTADNCFTLLQLLVRISQGNPEQQTFPSKVPHNATVMENQEHSQSSGTLG